MAYSEEWFGVDLANILFVMVGLLVAGNRYVLRFGDGVKQAMILLFAILGVATVVTIGMLLMEVGFDLEFENWLYIAVGAAMGLVLIMTDTLLDSKVES